jgi:hypothetical protein
VVALTIRTVAQASAEQSSPPQSWYHSDVGKPVVGTMGDSFASVGLAYPMNGMIGVAVAEEASGELAALQHAACNHAAHACMNAVAVPPLVPDQ